VKKKRWLQVSFFRSKKAHQTKGFCPRMVKNCQHQHKGRQHTQKESQGAATSVGDAIIILRGLNFCGAYCTVCTILQMVYHSEML
jgi:hypothetical protein